MEVTVVYGFLQEDHHLLDRRLLDVFDDVLVLLPLLQITDDLLCDSIEVRQSLNITCIGILPASK